MVFIIKPGTPIEEQLQNYTVEVRPPHRTTAGEGNTAADITVAEIRLVSKTDSNDVQPLYIETPTLPLYGIFSPKKHKYNKAYTVRISSDQSQWLTDSLGALANLIFSQFNSALISNPTVCPKECADLLKSSPEQFMRPFFTAGTNSQYVRCYEKTTCWRYDCNNIGPYFLSEMDETPGQGYYRLRLNLSNVFVGTHGQTKFLASIATRCDQVLFKAAELFTLNNLDNTLNTENFMTDIAEKQPNQPAGDTAVLNDIELNQFIDELITPPPTPPQAVRKRVAQPIKPAKPPKKKA